ncbi:MAG: peptidoglycan DD-metalloendopeptidase family protein [Deltaproteobacteria bacterium]|nr:peptidoglycan DD-metalloendopeptidase family protein [Deltaproteobacteria bacterium]
MSKAARKYNSRHHFVAPNYHASRALSGQKIYSKRSRRRANIVERPSSFYWRFVAVAAALMLLILFVGLDLRIPSKQLPEDEVTFFPPVALGALAEPRLAIPTSSPFASYTVVHRVKSGETWAALANIYGFPVTVAGDIKEAFDTLSKAKGVRGELDVGQELFLTFDPLVGLAKIKTSGSRSSAVEVSLVEDGKFVGRVKELPKTVTERVLLGEITEAAPSFAQAAYKAGVMYDLVDDLVDLFSDRVRFSSDFQVGDRFTVIYKEEVLEDGTVLTPGPILAGTLSIKGKHFSAIRYVGNDGVARYFDEGGRHLGNAFLRYPVKFSRISSYFSTSRFHPVLKHRRPHNGVDFAAAHGTPVRTVADGRIVFAGRKGGNGNLVTVQHTDRYRTAYAHLAHIAKGIRNGVMVKRGEVIGAVGATGLATGPHLHFAFFDRGRYVDPLKVDLPTVDILRAGQKISERYLERAILTLDRYQKLDLGDLYASRW